MNHNKYLFTILSFLILAMSCKEDFLNVPDKTSVLRQEYVKDLKTTGDYLNGIYLELSSNFCHGYSGVYPEIIADNIKPKFGGPFLNTQYSWNQQADDEKATKLSAFGLNANGLWFAGYRIIRDCNFILETVDKYSDENVTKANDIKGQAYTLRALIHHILVNAFSQSYNYTPNASHSGIPYITTSDWRQPVSRQTVAEVYANIISDLKNATGLLPNNSSNTLIVNKNAAKALLARVYLFKEDYTAAKNFAVEVGSNVPIMTGESYPDKLFTEQETEALFQLPPASAAAGYYTFFSGFYFRAIKQFLATNDIAIILLEQPNDIRSTWVTNVDGDFNITKFPVGVTSTIPAQDADYYHSVIRSSEMYLAAAESYAKLNMEDSARFFLDAIRKRADITALSSTAAGPALLDSIYKERRKELAFEGYRMYDLLRWKKGVNRMDAPNPSAQNLPYPSNRAIAPIPLSDVSISGLSQNTGY